MKIILDISIIMLYLRINKGTQTKNERGRAMTASELKANYEAEQGGNFFTRDNMKFFGDRMSNYGVRSAVIDTWTETGIDCWELYRKHPVKMGNKKSTYFDKRTFEIRHKREN